MRSGPPWEIRVRTEAEATGIRAEMPGAKIVVDPLTPPGQIFLMHPADVYWRVDDVPDIY